MPLAPKRAVCGKSSIFIIPVKNAVINITKIMFALPYFSSSIGPISSSIVIFELKCAHPACPKTWHISLTYVKGSVKGALYTQKNSSVVLPLVTAPKMRVTRQIKENVRITGELNEILFILIFNYPFPYKRYKHYILIVSL
jgi:hypothetical protein